MDPSTLIATVSTLLGQAPQETAETVQQAAQAITGADLRIAGAFIGAGICMGFGAIGPGIGEGFAAGKACEAIGRAPENAGLLTRTMLIGQAVSESTGIYSLVVAFLILFALGG